jgi:hypothetical protein
MTYIHFEIDGKSVDLDKVEDQVVSMLLTAMALQYDNMLKRLRCPDHGGRAVVHVRDTGLDHWDVDVSGCCPEFVAEARQRL